MKAAEGWILRKPYLDGDLLLRRLGPGGANQAR